MEPCPNLTQAPHFLLIRSPSIIHAIPEASFTDPTTHLSGSKKLATIGNFVTIATDSSPAILSLSISLTLTSTAATTPDWHLLLKTRLKKYLDDWSDFLIIEQVGNRSRLHLIQYGKSPEIVSAHEIKLWIVPVAKVHLPESSKTPTPDPATNGEKKIIKKKIIKKIVKKKSASAAPSPLPPADGAMTPEPSKAFDRESSRKSLSNGVESNGSTSKSGSKEPSPEVVQEVVEDVTSVSYLIKMGLIPAEDGVSLKEEHHKNGINGDEKKINNINGYDNSLINGDKSTDKNDKGMNGYESKIRNGINYAETSDEGYSSSKTNGLRTNLSLKTSMDSDDYERPTAPSEFPPKGLTLNTARKFDETVNGISPANAIDESDAKSLYSSVSETISSTISEISQNGDLSSPPPQKCPLSPVIKINDHHSSEDDDMSFSSVRSSSVGASRISPTTIRPTSTTTTTSATPSPTPTTVLSGFLSSVASGLGFTRGSSPSASTRLSTAGTLTPISSDTNIPGRINGLRHSDSSEWSLRSINNSSSALGDRLSRRRSSSTLRSLGRRCSPVHEVAAPITRVRGMPQMPVQALQEILKTLSYKELGEMRRVHPHWDELCGQLLNSGYYSLINKADVLLQDCQRRVYSEKELQTAITALTNLQVHVLNPVDMMRAPMDEGVLCFPYGQLLDKAFELVDRIERVVQGKDDPETAVLPWQRLADLSRRAQSHYRRWVEPEVEKRMSEVSRLQATARLQRIDSFLVETTVTKLERDTEQARNDLSWEIEQLKTQNAQLKKDNRELKQNHSRLEGRVEALERKFKTVARLLQ
uniref:F-box domain-containing protein n=1 Tax=Panagrolaimus sp. ES5 TaxID=591445 RepID=A0AC34FQ31_9BILA